MAACQNGIPFHFDDFYFIWVKKGKARRHPGMK
jgi:hypothetical protein